MLLFTVFGLSTLAAALPEPQAGQSTKSVWKRDEIDKWEGKGDKWEVEIGVGGGDFNWGTSPMWSTIDTLHQHCNGMSCNSEWAVDTLRLSGDDSDDPRKDNSMHLRLYGVFDDWMKQGLIDILKHASSLESGYKRNSDIYYWDPPCDQPASDECTWGAEGPVDQYHASKRYTVRVHNKETGEDHHIIVEAVEDADEGVDWCSVLGGVAAGVGGAIDPMLGGGISVLTLMCD